MRNISLWMSIGVLILLSSCQEKETHPFSFNGKAFVEGPLFAGPNTGQLEMGESLTNWLKEMNATADMISEVKLKKVSYKKDADQPMELISDAGLVFTANDLDMVNVAALNPLPADVSSADLPISQEAEITEFFKSGDFIMLIDLGLNEDLYDNYYVEVGMEFDITLSK